MIDYKIKDPQEVLTKLTSPDRYEPLLQTPQIKKEFENQKGFPVDGSLKDGRLYAPFIIEVIPPLIYTNTKLGNLRQKSSRRLFTSSWKQNNSFRKAKQNIQNKLFFRQSPGNTYNSRQKPQDFISASGAKNKNDPFLADARQAADIAAQLLGIINVPPLVFLINPQSMSIQHTKLQQFSERTRNGYVFQAWGENHPQISFSCKIGAFMAGAYENRGPLARETSTPSGLQWASRHNSASWQNLSNIFQVYLNNGYIVDSVQNTFVHHFIGCLAIRYDQWVYLGNMKTFSFSYEDTGGQGGIQFDFTFGVIAMYDVAPFSKEVRPLRAPTNSPSSFGF